MVEGTAPAIQCGLHVHSLFPGPKEDFDFPTTTVEFTGFSNAQFARRQVRHQQVPMATFALRSAECFSPARSTFAGFFEILPSHFRIGTHGNETATMLLFFTEQNLPVPVATLTSSEGFLNLIAGEVSDDDADRNATQPRGQKPCNEGEFSDDEVAHVPQDEVPFSHDIDEVFANFLVLLSAAVEGILHTGSTDEIESHIDLEKRGFTPPIAVAGAVIGVGMVEPMSRGILDQNATKALAERF